MLAAAAVSEGGGVLVPLWTIAVSSTLLLVDLHRRKEFALLHNLGIVTSQAVVVGTVPAIIMEALLLPIGR